MKTLHESYDVVVCGGGLAGLCAAIAAARQHAKVCLIQDRPVLGGNSSSEIRVTPHGAACIHAYGRETGIISELLIEERVHNHEEIIEVGWTNSIWDLTQYNLALATPGLTFHLNTRVDGVTVEGADNSRFIKAIHCTTFSAETERIIDGKIFIDCTGDGVVAHLAECKWRMGTEGFDETGEPHAPPTGTSDTMGSSLLFRARDMGQPCPFQPPEWAITYDNPDFFYKGGRIPWELRGGYWWIEIGIPWHTIHDNEQIRHELTRHVLGIWDWIKNHDPLTIERAKNFALDWIGQVPGKRESRRIDGLFRMSEHDLISGGFFEDTIAFGGWFIDLHTPGGLLASTSEPSTAEGNKPDSKYALKTYLPPYGIPLRSLIAADCTNLMMAGRNISVTKAALGTVRVMATTALLGQAAGTCAAHSLRKQIPLHEMPSKGITEIQQQLLRDGCFLPGFTNCDPKDLARSAKITASSQALLYGAELEYEHLYDGLLKWNLPLPGNFEKLDNKRGQWIALGKEGVKKLSVCLSNLLSENQDLVVTLSKVKSIWDYNCGPEKVIKKGQLKVPANAEKVWISWEPNIDIRSLGLEDTYVRLELEANPNILWHISGFIPPGMVSAFDTAQNKMRRFKNGWAFTFRIEPPQSCWKPESVLSGVTRPYENPNLWRSDPTCKFPQWINLTWQEVKTISIVELTFAGHLLWEYHGEGPFYKDRQTVKDYAIEILHENTWVEVIRKEGNYQRQNKIKLMNPVTTTALRVRIDATNGDPSCAIYEIRCYE